MGGWYTIGLSLGVGLAFGVILCGLLGTSTLGASVATAAGVAAGGAFGLLVSGTPEAVAGGLGAFLGAAATTVVVRGAMRRGATRMGVAAYVGGIGVVALLLSLVPAVGYVLAVALPVLAVRMRGREAARYAGLRTLAK